MNRSFHPLRPVTSRLAACLWGLRGRRRLRRGQIEGSIEAFRQALRSRPCGFNTLVDLATAHLYARNHRQAHRALAQAREEDPRRFEMRAGRRLARWGFDLGAVGSMPAPQRPEPVAQAAGRRARTVTAQSLPFGDCQNLDEYARFRAMPPISRAEVEGLDWDRVLNDLLDD